MSGRARDEVKRSFGNGNPLRWHSMNQRNLKTSFDGAARLSLSKKQLRSLRRINKEAERANERRERVAAMIKDGLRRRLEFGFDGINGEILAAGIRYVSGSRERR